MCLFGLSFWGKVHRKEMIKIIQINAEMRALNSQRICQVRAPVITAYKIVTDKQIIDLPYNICMRLSSKTDVPINVTIQNLEVSVMGKPHFHAV